MDPRPGYLSNYSSTVWGVGFRYWVTSIIAEMRRKSPVQQWVDSIPANASRTSVDRRDALKESRSDINSSIDAQDKSTTVKENSLSLDVDVQMKITDLTNLESDELNDNISTDDLVEAITKRSSKMLIRERSTNSEGNTPRHRYPFFRDSSFQSEGATSRCSSVESLLESRKVDAEAVLRGVGFGPSPSRQQLARIPDRFLKPSKVEGINTEQFIKEEQKSMKMHECGVFGYRGLTGNPHVPPSTIVAKIIERISSREELPESSYYLQITQQADIDTF